MGMGAIGNLVQPTPATPGVGAAAPAPAAAAPAAADPSVQLAQYKKMLDEGLINDADFDALNKKILGL